MAARRTGRGRCCPRPADRGVRDRLPPWPAPHNRNDRRGHPFGLHYDNVQAQPTTLGPVQVTPALVARGKALYTSDGCSACHSLSGTPGAGPSFKGLAGGTSTLTTGQTVTADDAYLERSIADPDAQIVKGYHQGIMAPAVAGFGLSAKPDDIRALVAFIKSQK